jgi:2,3-bisphosphoglycerate-independent phosphoglycerate mutase
MKLAVVILSGAADRPVEALGGRTPLDAAELPALADLAGRGRVCGVQTIPAEIQPSAETATATILGRDPTVDPPRAGAYLAGRLGVELGPRDLAFRCDLVNLFEGAVVDPTAGRIGDDEAKVLFESLNEALGSDSIRFRPGDRWRGLLVVAEAQAEGVRTRPPGSFLGARTADRGPVGPGADLLRSLMDRAAEILPRHDINSVRIDLGENPANGIWIWGEGRLAARASGDAPGTAVGSHPSFLGFAAELGFRTSAVAPSGVPAGTLEEIGGLAASALDADDFVVAFLDGTMEHSLLGEVDGKVRYLKAADEWVIRPLADRVLSEPEGRILVVASHLASVEQRRVFRDAVPFLVAGGGTARFGDAAFNEETAAVADLTIDPGHDLLSFARRA